ncbi:MAG TPA: metal-dependent hydrolase, partial [Marmoricola sp.]|nr:metal-dependent hydrolase [Marmoricola sp.]
MSHASTPGQPVVEVRRSKRRKRTVSAYERDGVIVVMIPDRSTKAQEARYVADLVAKLQRKAHLRSSTEIDLVERA